MQAQEIEALQAEVERLRRRIRHEARDRVSLFSAWVDVSQKLRERKSSLRDAVVVLLSALARWCGAEADRLEAQQAEVKAAREMAKAVKAVKRLQRAIYLPEEQ